MGLIAAIVASLTALVGGSTLANTNTSLDFAHSSRGHGSASTAPSTTAPATTTTAALAGAAPASAAATGGVICGDTATLAGPASVSEIATFDPNAPLPVVTVAAGNNSAQTYNANTTYYFAAGVHKLGTSQFGQIIPKNGDVFIGAPGAILDGQNKNRYAFTGNATAVTIEYLTIRKFGNATWISGSVGNNEGAGVVNHDAASGWKVRYNWVHHNAGAGVFVGSGSRINHNCLDSNGEYGFSSYTPCPTLVRNPSTGVVTTYCSTDPPGPTNIVLTRNEISNNDTFDFEAHNPGCGCTGGGKFWASTDVEVTRNYVHDNLGEVGLWADTVNNGFLFAENYLEDNYGVAIWYEISYNAHIVNNTFVGNGLKGPVLGGFPEPTIYISESGGDERVPNDHGFTTLDISGNVLIDNWAGVVLWENASRYCGTHGNPDTGYCTEGDPDTVLGPDPSNIYCNVAAKMRVSPWILECRWRTQNVAVHDNTFALVQAHVTSCTHGAYCGFTGVFSANANGGFAPYSATGCHDLIEDSITGSVQTSTGNCAGLGEAQNNTFTNNRYCGSYSFAGNACGTGGYWRFMPHEQGQSKTFAQWQSVDTTAGEGSGRHPAFDQGSSCVSCS